MNATNSNAVWSQGARAAIQRLGRAWRIFSWFYSIFACLCILGFVSLSYLAFVDQSVSQYDMPAALSWLACFTVIAVVTTILSRLLGSASARLRRALHDSEDMFDLHVGAAVRDARTYWFILTAGGLISVGAVGLATAVSMS